MNRSSIFFTSFRMFFILFGIALLNIFLPYHYISLFFLGVTFYFFSISLKEKNFFIITCTLIITSFFETSQGVPFLSVFLLFLLISLFFQPFIEKIFSLEKISIPLAILSLYSALFILFYLTHTPLQIHIFFILFGNMLLEAILFWIFL